MQSRVFLCLGSNCGDRHAMIGRAAAAISDAFETLDATVRVAEPVSGPAQGFESETPFVNVGIMVTMERDHEWTPFQLHAILALVKGIERAISVMPHRNPDGSYRDREIDIDLIAVDDIVYESDKLSLPHPRMTTRDFVLGPMDKLCPGWVHPLTGLTPAQMLRDLEK